MRTNMKQLFSLCLSAVLLGVVHSAGATSFKDAPKLPFDGFMKTAPAGIAEPGVQGQALLNETRTVNPFVRKSPARLTAGGSEIYGWGVWGSGVYNPAGLYSIEANTVESVWHDDSYLTSNSTLSGGYYIDDKICGVNLYSIMGYVLGYSWMEFDFSTGEILESHVLDTQTSAIFTRMAYNSTDGCLYGTGMYMPYNGGNSTVFMKAPADDLSDVTVLADIPSDKDLCALCYNESEQCFYGINRSSELVKITTGGETEAVMQINLSEIGFSTMYFFGMVYSPIEKVYYMSPMTGSQSYIATIDTATQSVEVLYDASELVQLGFMFTTDEASPDPDQPSKPELVSSTFMQGSTSGWNIYRIPSTYGDGSPIEDSMTAVTLVDGEIYREYIVKAGKQLRATYLRLTPGHHTFGFYVVANGKESRKISKKLYIGFDTPSSPANVVLDNDRISWDAVYTSENGGYVNYSDIQYRVTLNGEELGMTDETEFAVNLPENEPLNLYTAEVTAVYRDNESTPAVSNSITVGQPLPLPVNIIPTETQSQLCTVFDGDGDAAGWSYMADSNTPGEGYFSSASNSYASTDDWLILPPFEVTDTDRYYTLDFEVAIKYAAYNEEYIEVYAGTAADPAAMTTCIVAEMQPMDGKNTDFQKVIATFKAEQKGACYIGFHAVSAADQFGMYLHDINIVDNNITDESPWEVNNIEADPAEEGALSATISFNMPTMTIGGDEIASDAEIVATVSSSIETKTVKGTPGSRNSVDVEAMQGDNTFTIVASLGDFNSQTSVVNAYCGVYVPAAPEITESTVSEDMMSLDLKWNPVTTAFEEGEYVGDDITYTVYQGTDTGLFGIYWTPIESGVSECEYVYTLPEGTPQALYIIGLTAENAAGNCGTVNYVQVLMGTPYELPMLEDFSDGGVTTSPWMFYRPDSSFSAEWGWMTIADVVDAPYDGTSALGARGGAGSYAGISTPRFSTVDIEEAYIGIGLYADVDAPEITLMASYAGGESQVEIGSVQPAEGKGFDYFEFALPEELLGKGWVDVTIIAHFVTGDEVLLLTEVNVVDGTVAPGTSSVQTIDAGKGIYGGKGMVSVRGCEGSDVVIYSVNGAVMANSRAQSDNAVYLLEKGVYIVIAGNRKAKVIVR